MHNQTFTNDSECSGTTGLQWAQKGPCHTSLYLPKLAPGCSLHQVQDMLAYRTAPSYFHSLLKIYIPSRSLRSMNEQRLVDTSQRGTKSLSRTFSFTIPGWWNNLPTPLRNAESLTRFFFFGGGVFFYVWHLKTHLFPHPFDLIIKIYIYLLSLSLVSPCLACTNLNNAWNLYCKHFLLLVASLWLLYFSILDICILNFG